MEISQRLTHHRRLGIQRQCMDQREEARAVESQKKSQILLSPGGGLTGNQNEEGTLRLWSIRLGDRLSD